MTQYDNEFFRGPPEGSPTLATDQRPTGVEVFQAKPEATTVVADVPVTREEVPKDPPKKKSNARRITKAIKLLASCMAAVVITEAAVNIAATIEPPPEVPTGLYYEGQWPGVDPVHGGMYSMNMDSDMGYSIQVPVADQVWRLTAPNNWRMCWYEGTYQVYMGLYDRDTDVFLMADLTPEPFYTGNEEDCYTTVTTSTGDTLYVRAFFLSLGKYAEEYGMEDYGQSEEMLAASAELRQELLEEAFSGIRVTPGTEDGWQGFQIGDKLYSQQSENWYGLGGFGDLDIHIPWVNYAEDYNLHNMTPYSRVNVNGITWSIYFAENDTYLWAVPNIDPEICLGGLTARFMCADALRRGEYINDEEWTGFTSASQRQTAVDIMVECLQHHYALRDRWYPRDWPWKGATENASYWIWAESIKGTWTQFSFGDEAYRVNSTDPELRFYWETTRLLNGDMVADLEISRMAQNEEEYAIGMAVCRSPFTYTNGDTVYRTVQATGGETLYLEFRSHYHDNGPDFTSAELELIADQILGSISFQFNPGNSGWCPLLLCDTMYSPSNMEWSGCGIVGSELEISYIHNVKDEGLKREESIGTRTHNGITWTLYYDPGDENWFAAIWAVPDIEPDVCIGFEAIHAVNHYRDRYTDLPTYGWDDDFELPAEDFDHAMEAVAEALSYIYPLGVEPDAEESWYIPDWPTIHQITSDHSYGLMNYSSKATFAQFSMGNKSYRLDSRDSNLRFFWNGTEEVDGGMEAELHVSYMNNLNRDWWMKIFVRETPFTQPRDENWEIDGTLSVSDGSTLYLRFSYMSDAAYTTFTGWATQIMDAISASPANPNGWGQVWICDLMTSPVNENWDGNAMVTDDYEIPYFNRAEEQGLWELEPYGMQVINGIRWTFIYEEADDIIWGLPDFDLRPDVQWCIGAPAREMAQWFANKPLEEDYLDAAVEGLMYGLSHYYPRRLNEEEQPIEPPPVVPEEGDWPTILAAGDGSDRGGSLYGSLNTYGLISVDHNVFQIDSHRQDLRFWWEGGSADQAQVTVYSVDGHETLWAVTMDVRLSEYTTFAGDESSYRTLRIPGNVTLHLRFTPWFLEGTPLETIADQIVNGTDFDYSGKEEYWHKVNIGHTLQTEQSYEWNGLSMVYEDYGFRYVHEADAYDVHQQDYEGQRTINGILWTFRFHKDNNVMYACPNLEPNLCIGADPDMLYRWYEAEYGARDDYFETLVESMSVGLQNYYSRSGVIVEREEKTDPVYHTEEINNYVQISLGERGYYLQSDMDNAWMVWYFTRNHGGVLAADLSMGADCSANVYISEAPLAMYDNRSHGQIPVEGGGTLYWYCIEMYSGTDAQLADLMNSLTVTGATPYQWGGVMIEDRIYSRQSLEWSGWETVETDGGRPVLMFNLERPAMMELGDPIAQQKINKVVWTLYITEEYSSRKWPFIWAVPDVDPNLAIGSDYQNIVYKYFEDRGMMEDFDRNIWSAESRNGAAEVIFEVLQNYYPR